MRRIVCMGVLVLVPFAAAARQALTADAVPGLRFERVAGGAAEGSVLDVGNPGGWVDQAVGTPSVIRAGGTYRMWFTGVRATAHGESPYLFRTAIGLATSRDGLRWTLANEGRPVLPPGGEGTFDALATGQPTVLRSGNRYLMWYGGADGRQSADSVRIERIGAAESRDGVRWTRLNGGRPVLDVGPPGSIDAAQATGPFVLRHGGEFRMWYGAFNGRHTIAAARSRDGLTWTKEAVTGLGEGEALGPAVYSDGHGFHMFYSVVRDSRWTLVQATSPDGLHWRPADDGRPVLGAAAAGGFDAAGKGQNHSVHPSGLVRDGDRVRLYYMAESPRAPFPQRIGLMEAALTSPASPRRMRVSR